jgi:hypothetical protein
MSSIPDPSDLGPKQGDGSHLPTGSVMRAISELRYELAAAKKRIRELEAALAETVNKVRLAK